MKLTGHYSNRGQKKCHTKKLCTILTRMFFAITLTIFLYGSSNAQEHPTIKIDDSIFDPILKPIFGGHSSSNDRKLMQAIITYMRTSDQRFNGKVTLGNTLNLGSDKISEIFTIGNDSNWRIGYNAGPKTHKSKIKTQNNLKNYQYITYFNNESNSGYLRDGVVIGQNNGKSSFEIYGGHKSFFRGDMAIGTEDTTSNLTVTGDIYTYKKSEKDHRIGYSKKGNNNSGINTEKVDGNFQFITYPNNFGGILQNGGFIIGENTGNSTMEMYGNSETFFRGNVHLGLKTIPSDLNVSGKTTSKDLETSGTTNLNGNTTISNLTATGTVDLRGANTTYGAITTRNHAQLNGGATTTNLTVNGTTNLNGIISTEHISSSSLGVTGHTSSNSLGVTNDISSNSLSLTGNLFLDSSGEIFTANKKNNDWRIGFNEDDNSSKVALYKDLDFYQYITYNNDYMGNGGDESGFVLGQNGKNSSLEIYGNHESFFRGDMQIGINKEKERSNLKISGNLGIGTTKENPEGVSLNVIGGVNINAGLTVQKSATVMDTLHVGKMIHGVGGVNTSNITATGSLAIGTDTPLEGAALTILGNTYIGSQASLDKHKDKSLPESAKKYMLWVDGDIGINGGLGSGRKTDLDAKDYWPDYVFDIDYKLIDIPTLTKYIKDKNHLPNMPSAQDIKENGYGLHDMNKRLLRTVEELTLHTINQEEKILGLQDQLDAIKQLIINSNK